MNTRQRQFAVAALLLFVGAALAWLQSSRTLHQRRLLVVDHPIRLEPDLAFTYPLRVDLAACYQVELTCRRLVPPGVLDQALNKDLAADYEVSTGNDRVAGGDALPSSGLGGTSAVASRLVGRFPAQPGRLYLLRIHFTRGLPILAATQPTIRVSVDPAVSRPIYARAQTASVLALILAVLGVGCLRMAFARYFFRRRAIPG